LVGESGLTFLKVWPRGEELLAGLNVWSDVLRSWCDVGDPVCAGGDDPSAHKEPYFNPTVAQEAGDFVRSKL
jgi:acetylxylan esterase